MRPNLHGGSIRRPLRTSYIVVGTRRRPPSQNPPLAKWQHAKTAPRSQHAVAPTITHARVPSTTTSQRIPRQLTGAKELYDFHISSDQPAHQARLLRTTLNSLVERAKPPDRPIMKTRRTNSSIPRPRARAQELSASPFPLRVQEAGGNDHHPTSRELPTEYFPMP